MFAQFKSLIDLMDFFPKGDNQKCIEHLEKAYWNGIAVSPFDKGSKVYTCKNGNYKCKNSNKYFKVTTGTMFENTKIPLRLWFMAMWVINSHKSGYTSVNLGKDIGVSQKTAWFLLQRIRSCHAVENNNELSGYIEMDESLIGGLDENRHVSKKSKNTGAPNYGKTWVFGMLQRGGKINIWAVKDRDAPTIVPYIEKFVKVGSRIMSDAHKAYINLHKTYAHTVLNHAAYEYVSLGNKSHHNNGIESIWRVVKNAIHRTYNHVADKHLPNYLNESVFRINTRDLTDSDKFHWLLFNCGVRTKYKDLVAG